MLGRRDRRSHSPQLVTNSKPLGTLMTKASRWRLTFVQNPKSDGRWPRAEHGKVGAFHRSQPNNRVH